LHAEQASEACQVLSDLECEAAVVVRETCPYCALSPRRNERFALYLTNVQRYDLALVDALYVYWRRKGLPPFMEGSARQLATREAQRDQVLEMQKLEEAQRRRLEKEKILKLHPVKSIRTFNLYRDPSEYLISPTQQHFFKRFQHLINANNDEDEEIQSSSSEDEIHALSPTHALEINSPTDFGQTQNQTETSSSSSSETVVKHKDIVESEPQSQPQPPSGNKSVAESGSYVYTLHTNANNNQLNAISHSHPLNKEPDMRRFTRLITRQQPSAKPVRGSLKKDASFARISSNSSLPIVSGRKSLQTQNIRESEFADLMNERFGSHNVVASSTISKENSSASITRDALGPLNESRVQRRKHTRYVSTDFAQIQAKPKLAQRRSSVVETLSGNRANGSQRPATTQSKSDAVTSEVQNRSV